MERARKNNSNFIDEDRGLIIIITTAQHGYTHKELESLPDLSVRVITYLELEGGTRPDHATYIFTDLDRLAPWAVHRMAEIYRELQDRGERVLNDPAGFASRFGLLRALNRSGINQFDAYRVDSLERPLKWPVFLRVEGEHSAPVSDLLKTEQELDAAIESAVRSGTPKSALLAIEYAAEPVRPGLFRKLSAFKIGDRLVGATGVHDDQWVVKYGKLGIASAELYEEEYGFVANCPFADVLSKAFELGGIDYGRVDFGLVDGKPQIYEINSNPDLKLYPAPSPSARRNESMELFRSNYFAALRAIDTPAAEHA